MRIPLTKEQIQELIRLFNKYSKSTVGIEYDVTDTTDILSDINSSYSTFSMNYHARAKLGADLKFSKRQYNFVKVIYKILIGQLTPETVLRDLFSYPPVALPATIITDVAYRANWQLFTGAQGYLLEYSIDPTFTTSTIVDAGNVLFYNIAGLTQNTNYYYRIKAYKTVNLVQVYSDYSNRITVLTQYSVPLAPNALPATNRDWEEFTANWSPMANVQGFYIDVATDAGFNTLVVNNLQLPGALLVSHVVNNMIPQDDYWYRIRAYNIAGTSPNSNVIQTSTVSLAVPVIQPETLVSYDNFTANWIPTNDCEGYLVQVCLTVNNFSPNITNWNDKIVVGVGSSSQLVSNPNPDQLLPSTNYSYRVRAYKYAGLIRYISGFSGVENVTTAAASLAAPVATAATNLVPNVSFDANWLSVPGATAYLITCYKAGAPNVFIYTNFNVGNVLTYTINGPNVANCNFYDYSVKATDGILTSAASNHINGTLAGMITLADPVTDAATDIAATSFTANWHPFIADPNILSYNLEVSDDNFMTIIGTGYNQDPTGTSESVIGLTTGVPYKYRVRARRRVCASGYSNATSVTPVVPVFPLIDMDSNPYMTVTINGQEWCVENYRSATVAGGNPIRNVTSAQGTSEWNTYIDKNMTNFNASGGEVQSANGVFPQQFSSTGVSAVAGDKLYYDFILSASSPMRLVMYIDDIYDSEIVALAIGVQSFTYTCAVSGVFEFRFECIGITNGISTNNTFLTKGGDAAWTETTVTAYCWYDNNIIYKDPYGALYNGTAISDPNFVYLERNMAQELGWRVATTTDWGNLITFLGVNSGNQMKEAGTTHWLTPNGGTNTTGLAIIGAGYRAFGDGSFNDLQNYTEIASDPGEGIQLYFNNAYANVGNIPNTRDGISVRLVRDAPM